MIHIRPKGFQNCKHYVLKIIDDVFIPPGLGLETISKGGLVSFSNTVNVQFDPIPGFSKSIGTFLRKQIK